MNGVINFLKPPGMSSNGAVVYLRALLGEKKTGHAGTLDPGACGVLPICIGKATKISSFLMGGTKEYIAEVTFGASTDTGDSYGKIKFSSDKAIPSKNDVIKALKSFTGRQSQNTPIYSAVKINGRNSYELARKGIDVPVKIREIEISDIEYIEDTNPKSHLIRVVCGKGTYIRALCEDIGEALGVPAYMSFLIRTKCAGLNIEDSYTADEISELDTSEKAIVPMDVLLGRYPKMTVSKSLRPILFNGGTIDFDSDDAETARIYADEEFLGLACVKNKKLKITVLLVDR